MQDRKVYEGVKVVFGKTGAKDLTAMNRTDTICSARLGSARLGSARLGSARLGSDRITRQLHPISRRLRLGFSGSFGMGAVCRIKDSDSAPGSAVLTDKNTGAHFTQVALLSVCKKEHFDDG